MLKLMVTFACLLSIIFKIFSTHIVFQILMYFSFSAAFLITIFQISGILNKFTAVSFVKYSFMVISLSQALMFAALLFAYEQFFFWKVSFVICFSIYSIIFCYLMVFIKNFLMKGITSFFIKNILLPSLIIIILSVPPVVFKEDIFYKFFNNKRNTESYAKHIQKPAPENNSHIPEY